MKRALVLVTSDALAALLLTGAVALAADRGGAVNLRHAAPVYISDPVGPADAPLAQRALETGAAAADTAVALPIGPVGFIGPVSPNGRTVARTKDAGKREHDDHAEQSGRDSTRAREVRH